MPRIITSLFVAIFYFACQDEVKENTAPDGMRLTIEYYQDSIVLEAETQAKIIAKGFIWCEGPVWVEETNSLLVSDIPGNLIYQWSSAKGQQTYLKHAGFADTLDHRGSDGSNG